MTDMDRRAMVALGLGVIGLACTKAKDANDEKEEEGDVGPLEDLMREHGILERILLVYEEGARRLEAGNAEAMAPIAKGADLVRTFVEEYHERSEEQHIFPRMEKAKRQVDLVATLKTQHEKGRALTALILESAKANGDDARKRVIDATRAFSRMYRPHAAREDTVLFAEFRLVVSPKELAEIGERFEEVEHKQLGKTGFEDTVRAVAAIEATLGIDRLDTFTP